ncbi:uncharacterized protein LOC128213423 [Mya arenaria]|uniref:uncharacterized protein LOC128213423 n=1 Tax=Mya arenaria TaxID=6604 RepID=UPI0022E1F930|nr:uncharacterized protein LOC128213423 [Mya arenaria]
MYLRALAVLGVLSVCRGQGDSSRSSYGVSGDRSASNSFDRVDFRSTGDLASRGTVPENYASRSTGPDGVGLTGSGSSASGSARGGTDRRPRTYDGPPPEEGYLGGRGGYDGLPVQGGYCGEPECADGGVREGMAMGRPGEGSAMATADRQRTGREDMPTTFYEQFSGGPATAPGMMGGGYMGMGGGMGTGGGMGFTGGVGMMPMGGMGMMPIGGSGMMPMGGMPMRPMGGGYMGGPMTGSGFMGGPIGGGPMFGMPYRPPMFGRMPMGPRYGGMMR